MKKTLFAALLLGWVISLKSQTLNPNEGNDFVNQTLLNAFLQADSVLKPAQVSGFSQHIAEFCRELKTQKADFSSEKKFLQKVFVKAHRKYLKTYQLNSPFSKIFTRGYYDCVSGTMLYALILKELGIKYHIKETPFHAYLVVNLGTEGKVLLESTNFLAGFIEDEKLIQKTEEDFTQLYNEKKELKVFNRIITPRQLLGLQYYNQALIHFNQQKFKEANQILRQATRLYTEDRIEALLQLTQLHCQAD